MEIPMDKRSDQSYLLKCLRKSFQNETEMVHDIGMDALLGSMSEAKTKHLLSTREAVKTKRMEKVHQLRREKLILSLPVKHSSNWNFSTSSDRKTRPPHALADELENMRKNEISKGSDKEYNKNPWLPTCLRGHDFGHPSCDTLTEEYVAVLEQEIQYHIEKCKVELMGLVKETEEESYQRAMCSQAIGQYEAMLIDIKKNRMKT